MSSNTAWVDTPTLTPPDPRTALSHVVGRLNAAHAELITLMSQVLADPDRGAVCVTARVGAGPDRW